MDESTSEYEFAYRCGYFHVQQGTCLGYPITVPMSWQEATLNNNHRIIVLCQDAMLGYREMMNQVLELS